MEGFLSPSRCGSRNGEKDWENASTTSSVASGTEYTGLRLRLEQNVTAGGGGWEQVPPGDLLWPPCGQNPWALGPPSGRSQGHPVSGSGSEEVPCAWKRAALQAMLLLVRSYDAPRAQGVHPPVSPQALSSRGRGGHRWREPTKSRVWGGRLPAS